MSDLRPIPTPLAQHLHRIRFQLIPVLIFGGGVLLTGWLWQRHLSSPNATAEVEVVQADIISQVDGVLANLPNQQWEVLDAVKASDMMAMIDDSPTRAALDTLRADLARLEKELTAADARFRQEQGDRRDNELAEAARLAVAVERARLDVLDRKTLIETDRVELKRRDELVQLMRELVKLGVQSQFMLVTTEIPRDIVAERVAGAQTALKTAEAQMADAEARRKAYSPEAPAELAVLLAPVREAITVQEARIRELGIRIDSLAMRCPISGTVTAIYRRPGQAVRAGDPIMTVAATESRHIISYIRQNQRIRPDVGMAVEVRVRSTPQRMVKATVDRVGPRVEPIPAHQLWDPRVPEWGLPVRIAMPGELKLRPGELVDVRFPMTQ